MITEDEGLSDHSMGNIFLMIFPKRDLFQLILLVQFGMDTMDTFGLLQPVVVWINLILLLVKLFLAI